jgi:hypothetical protein
MIMMLIGTAGNSNGNVNISALVLRYWGTTKTPLTPGQIVAFGGYSERRGSLSQVVKVPSYCCSDKDRRK